LRDYFLETIVLSPRKRTVKQLGLDGSRPTSLWHEKLGDVPPRVRSTPVPLLFTPLSPEELLGPLNDVERKFAPREIFTSGPMEIPLPRPRVAIVGSRRASPSGLKAASDIATTLSRKRVVIVSGLAEGIDTAAHKATLEEGGRTIGVIGTALDHAYPKQNSKLQDEMMKNQLVISQFPIGYPTRPENFVIRNRTMALVANASIIVEAREVSGSLHQGWEALRLGRPLFIWKSVVNNSSLSWPKKMMSYGALELEDPSQVMDVLPSSERIIKIAV
jgi:DNA processing protein